MRKAFVAGNWKMNLTRAEAIALASAVVAKTRDFAKVDIGIVPAFVHIDSVGQTLKGSAILLGAQDACSEKNGAFTGEISTAMLIDLGVKFVLVGHSERRHVFGETDAVCNKKLLAVINAGLIAVLCIGEKIEERQANQTFEVCRRQLIEGLKGFDNARSAQLVIAYEPVWAIGTGLTATKEQAQEVQAFVRAEMGKIIGTPIAAEIRIQYGGSVKASNAAELMSQPDVDGALVGGASLKAEEFIGIVSAAAIAKV